MDTPEVTNGLDEDSERLLDLTKVLTLDDCNTGLNPPFVDDILQLREQIFQQHMDSSEVSFDLDEGSGRLMALTKVLNLEDCDKSSNPICQKYPFVDDFLRVREHISQQKKTISIYGLDSALFDDVLFKKMQILASNLVLHSCSPMAYCNLRSNLFVEVIEFYDEVFAEVEIRLMSCTREDEIERIVQSADKLRNIYNIYM